MKGKGMEHKTGLEDYCVYQNHKKLRLGYTTGSCAAAAASAAASMLLTGIPEEETLLKTPKGILLRLQIEDICIRKDTDEMPLSVSCAVRKDGGDDIDATDGILIYAKVSKNDTEQILIDGGEGVGRVTKPGVDQPVGAAAINKTPRMMISEAVKERCAQSGYSGGLSVLIYVPEGVHAAKKTFNGRLGIEGGISILGTSGIVMPMSEKALLDSMRSEMKMLFANGGKYLVITPGNYGEAFSMEMGTLDLTFEMKCSNYVGETIDMAEEIGVQGILFIAHIGKFIKVAGGIMNTHSQNADARAELMAASAARCGANIHTVRKILDTPTTEDALTVLKNEEPQIFQKTMNEICQKISFYLNHRSRNKILTGAVIFSSVMGKLSQTENADQLISLINAEKPK